MMRELQSSPRGGGNQLGRHLTLLSCANRSKKRSMKCSMKAQIDHKKTPETQQCQG